MRFVSRILFKRLIISFTILQCSLNHLHNAGDLEFTIISFWPHNEAWRISHTMFFFISVIEMLTCGGGGLRDILFDSDVYVCASVDQMLSGKQYKRAVRELTLVYEAMMGYLRYLVVYFLSVVNR